MPSRIRLPFEKKAGDPGEWSYDHRAGICITLIVYLIIAIAFVWWKIDFGDKAGQGIVIVDFMEEHEQPKKLTPEEIAMLQAMQDDFRDVRNMASNENAELNSDLKDDKGTNASQLYEDAGSLDDKMRANREAYEEGLRQHQEFLNSRKKGSEDGEAKQDVKIKGRVTVSFSFTNPVRTSRNLVVPAYMCEGGGEVVVNVTLDINGYVSSASVDKSRSSSDECMQNTAVYAARNSRFNIDNTAPAKHKGTITYLFIPQ